jgi:hypothetical protein
VNIRLSCGTFEAAVVARVVSGIIEAGAAPINIEDGAGCNSGVFVPVFFGLGLSIQATVIRLNVGGALLI